MKTHYFIAGGAGFIGSHLAGELLNRGGASRVVLYDNFTSGKLWHLEAFKKDKRLTVVKADVKDKKALTKAMKGASVVYHLASNPDISKAVTQPDIDFWEGTYLTQNVVEAMRLNGTKKILYTSGSGVYGDTATKIVAEDHSPMLPISTYGASKLAGEALIGSYCAMFDMSAACFRFANVVGPHQTHGVGADFVKKLMRNPKELPILGDGSQDKSYLYVTDAIGAMRLTEKRLKGFAYYNVATHDSLKVRDIADLTVKLLGLRNVKYKFSGGDRGWKGDVPVIRLNSRKIRKLGWTNRYSSKEAMRQSLISIIGDAKKNRFGWKVTVR